MKLPEGVEYPKDYLEITSHTASKSQTKKRILSLFKRKK